ncbi:MAG: group 1 truncated hemoglobin [Pricia sp.]|nr:group 1 truncated hemoglobin [Pricia sp.]
MEKARSITRTRTLYERLGGETGVRSLGDDILDKNLNNPKIGHYFQCIDMTNLKQLVFEFFSNGIGGPHEYTGRDMLSAHTGLNISERDFEIANEDTIHVLKEHGVGDKEIDEVIAILNSLKDQVVHQ